jgi:hypothetical protein
MKSTFYKKTDILIILLLLLAGGAMWAIRRATLPEGVAFAQIYYNGVLVSTIDLTTGQDRAFSIPEHEDVVFRVTADGGIRFESSDCPDKICVNSGTLYLAGESAACIPNGLILKLVSDNENPDNALDIVIGQ